MKRDVRRVHPVELAPELDAAIRRGGKVVQNARVVDCVHGVPWTTCTLCSQVRR